MLRRLAPKILLFWSIFVPASIAYGSDPFGPTTLLSMDTKSKLVNGEWTNSIVGRLTPCMVLGETCPAIWVRLYKLGGTDNSLEAVGTLVKTGPAHWREYNYTDLGGQTMGHARFNFVETGRSNNVIQLNDSSRQVQLEIDLDNGIVRYGEDGGAKRPLYRAWGLRSSR